MYTPSFVQQVWLKENQESFSTRDHKNEAILNPCGHKDSH